MDTEEEIKCPECGGLRGGHASFRCSLMSLEYAQQKIIDTQQLWIGLNCKAHSNYQKVYSRLKKDIQALQGKVDILKNENNKLRKNPKSTTEKQQCDLWLEVFQKITELGMHPNTDLSNWLLQNIKIEKIK